MPLSGTYVPSKPDWAAAQVETFEATAGAEANDFRGMPIVVLTSVGAKSGFLRKNPLMRVEHNGEYAVVASNGGDAAHPVWYRNIVANPHVELQDGPVLRDYVAREVDGAEKAAWWERAVAAYPDFAAYQAGIDRVIPLFVLTPMSDGSAA